MYLGGIHAFNATIYLFDILLHKRSPVNSINANFKLFLYFLNLHIYQMNINEYQLVMQLPGVIYYVFCKSNPNVNLLTVI